MRTGRLGINRLVINIIFLSFGFALQGYMFLGMTGFFYNHSGWYFCLSFVCGVLLTSLIFVSKKVKSFRLFFYLSIMFGLLIPVIGSLAVFVIYFYRRVYFKADEAGENWDIALDNEIVALSNKNAFPVEDTAKYVLENLDVESYRDILKGDDLELKRSVISKLSEDDKKDDIQLLQETLKDPDPEIRFYASSALKKIEENFQKEFLALKEEISYHPDSISHNLMLGKEYFRFARSGLSDKTSERYYYEQARNCLKKAYFLDKENIDIVLEYGKALILLGEYKQALDCFNEAYQIDNQSWQVLIWRCEACYHLGKLKEIQNDCVKLKKLNPPWGTITNITNYWLEYA